MYTCKSMVGGLVSAHTFPASAFMGGPGAVVLLMDVA